MKCMLASEYKGWPKGVKYVTVEPKLDGFRLCVTFDEQGNRQYYCRSDKPVPWAANLLHIDIALQALDLRDCMLDGELTARSWNELQSLVKKLPKNLTASERELIEEQVTYNVFDFVPNDAPIVMQDARYEWLDSVRFKAGGPIRRAPVYLANNDDEVQEHYQFFLYFGYEGAMVKVPNGFYKPGQRSKNWLKLKPWRTYELKIEGTIEGKGKNAGMLGALLCEGGRRVGGGPDFTDDVRRELWARRDELPGQLVEVKVQDSDVSQARHIQFLRIREDLT